MTTTTHRVPLADFDQLATGRGDATTVAMLRRGQLSKHLLMLGALDAVATAVAPAQRDAAGFPAAFELLTEVQRSAPDVANDVLLHPHIGAWLCHCLQRLHADVLPDYRLRLDLAHAAGIAAAAAIRAGMTFRIPVHVHGGHVPLPTLGAAAAYGVDTVVIANEHGVRVESSGLTVAVPAEGDAVSGWLPLRRLTARACGLDVSVDLDDMDPYRGHNHPSTTGRLTDQEVDRWRELFSAAWQLLAEDHPAYANAIAAGLRSLVPQHTDDPGRSISATSTDAFGSIALSCPSDGVAMANTLVHEFQHAKLGALLDIVSLTDADPAKRYYAPWRDDPRPLPGLLQGTYAFLGVTDFWRIHRHRASTGPHIALPDFEFARWRTQTEKACAELLASGGLTEAGVTFVIGMQSTVTSWRNEPVPAELAEQARDTAVEHNARWRLRNLDPDPADVAALARAWTDGGVAGHTAESRMRPGAQAAHADTARLQLWHLRVTAPDEFQRLVEQPESAADTVSAATFADLTFVRGDMTGAIEAYRRRIDRAVEASAWIGLALALGRTGDTDSATAILRRPELLIAVHGHLRASGNEIEPEALARWLSHTLDRKRC